MEVAEYDFHTFFVHHILHSFRLPFCTLIPLLLRAFQNQIRILCRHHRRGAWRTGNSFYFVENPSWIPAIAIIHIAGIACPHSYIGAVFCNLQHTHITYYIAFFTMISHSIWAVRSIYIVIQYAQRFCCIFICINSNLIINTVIFQNQCRTRIFAAPAIINSKFFGICRCIYPAFRFTDWRQRQECWPICQMEHICIFPKYTVTYTIFFRIIILKNSSIFDKIFLIVFFHTRVIHVTTCKVQFWHWHFCNIAINMASAGTIRNTAAMITFCGRNNNTFFITFMGRVTHSTGRCAIYHIQILTVTTWRPSTTRPVEYQSFLSCFCGYIPQLFCFTKWGQERFHTHINFTRNWDRIVYDTMSHWIRSCSQCRPHWRRNGWHTSQEH